MRTKPSLSDRGGAHLQGDRSQQAPQRRLLAPLPFARANRSCGFTARSIPIRSARGHFRQIAAGAQSGGSSEQPTERSIVQSHGDNEREHASKVAEESLRLLEWPAVCCQVAAFASVSLTASNIVRNGLSIGRSQEESEKLLRQTAEAQTANLAFEDVYNLFPVVAAAQSGRPLNARHLNAVASTLDAVASLKAQLHLPEVERDRQAEASTSESPTHENGDFQSLAQVLAPAAGGAPELLAAIRHCIGPEDAVVLDRASEDLAVARRERRENLSTLRTESESWARQMFSQKASENAQGALPKGSVKMGASRSGATLYIEPAPLVDLNNAEARLAGREREAENRVLEQLTQQVARHSETLQEVMHAILALDVISARAGHATWLSGSMPSFKPYNSSDGIVQLLEARHPLLMQKALSRLPDVLVPDEAEFENSFMGGVAALRLDDDEGESQASEEEGSGTGGLPPGELPKPVDLTVPPGKASVILTGPNTGGKTASLKTLGLMALMAKAGLFLPLGSKQLNGACTLAWFDLVLADVGDSQDLAQSLSTFSGHVRRLTRITEATTPASLVLLDELGSGTDPVEGGALAAVLLEWLLDHAGLVFCTTHHAELKELAGRDERFVNANVEFDSRSLLPTYRLLWGEAGQSEALAVAEGLGFDRDVVADAREVMQGTNFASQPGQHAGQLKENLVSEVDEARRRADTAAKQRSAAENRRAELKKQKADLDAEWKRAEEASKRDAKGAEEAAARDVQAVVDAFADGKLSLEDAIERLEGLKLAAVEERSQAGTLFGQSDSEGEDFAPHSGETVRLLSMGGKTAKVVQPMNGGEKVAVRMGKLTLNVPKADVAPADAAAKQTAKKQKKPAKARPSGSGGGGGEKRDILRIQIPENTADLRGLRQDDAVAALERAFDDCPDDSVLFVVHGHGTGAVKAAVRRHLQRHSLVKRYYEEPESAGGCTVVEFQ